MSLTRDDFNAMGCGAPGCDRDHSRITLIAGCHPGAPFRVAYDKPLGTLQMACAVCGTGIAEVSVEHKGFRA